MEYHIVADVHAPANNAETKALDLEKKSLDVYAVSNTIIPPNDENAVCTYKRKSLPRKQNFELMILL